MFAIEVEFEPALWTRLRECDTEAEAIAAWRSLAGDPITAARAIHAVDTLGREFVLDEDDDRLVRADTDLGRAADLVHRLNALSHRLRQLGPLDDRGEVLTFTPAEIEALAGWKHLVDAVAAPP